MAGAISDLEKLIHFETQDKIKSFAAYKNQIVQGYRVNWRRVVEQASRSKFRAFWGAWVGFAIGIILGFGSVIIVKSLMTPTSFSAWGWRIFFVLGFLVPVVGLIIRTRTMDSFVFKRHKTQVARPRSGNGPRLLYSLRRLPNGMPPDFHLPYAPLATKRTKYGRSSAAAIVALGGITCTCRTKVCW
jgi:MFS family permease